MGNVFEKFKECAHDEAWVGLILCEHIFFEFQRNSRASLERWFPAFTWIKRGILDCMLRTLEFTLEEDEDMAEFGAPMRIINPAFIVKDWGHSGVSLKVNSKPVRQNNDFRIGYEETATGTDLIIWVKMQSHDRARFSISPK